MQGRTQRVLPFFAPSPELSVVCFKDLAFAKGIGLVSDARQNASTCLAELLTKAEARQSEGGSISTLPCYGGVAVAYFRRYPAVHRRHSGYGAPLLRSSLLRRMNRRFTAESFIF